MLVVMILLVAAVAAGCGGVDVSVDPQVKPLEERPKAANFSAPALNGDTQIALSDFAGTPVFLNFWASWCGPCREEMPALQEFSKAHPEVVVLGIASFDDLKSSRAFAKEVGVTFPLAHNPDNAVAEAYRARQLPVTVVIDAEGRIANTWFGPIDTQQLEEFAAQLV